MHNKLPRWYWRISGSNSSGRFCETIGHYSPKQCSSSVCGQYLPKQCTMCVLTSHFHSTYTSQWNLHSCCARPNVARNDNSSGTIKSCKVNFGNAIIVCKLLQINVFQQNMQRLCDRRDILYHYEEWYSHIRWDCLDCEFWRFNAGYLLQCYWLPWVGYMLDFA